MSKVQASTSVSNVKPDEVARFTDLCLADIVNIVNGNLDFGSNINCKLLSVTFSAANVNTAVTHNLGRAPAGYIVTKSSASANVFDGTVASNSNTLYLQASAQATVGLLVY